MKFTFMAFVAILCAALGQQLDLSGRTRLILAAVGLGAFGWLAYRLRAVSLRVWAAIWNEPRPMHGGGVAPSGADAGFGGPLAQQAYAHAQSGVDETGPFGLPASVGGVQVPPDPAAGGHQSGITPAFAAFQNFAFGGANGAPEQSPAPPGLPSPPDSGNTLSKCWCYLRPAG